MLIEPLSRIGDWKARLSERLAAVWTGRRADRAEPANRTEAGGPDAIFVWIPKTAGTSLFDSLEQHGCAKLKSVQLVRRHFRQRGLVTFGHMSIPAMLDAGLVDPVYFQRAKKFAFVRNPYDRALSLYHYLRNTPLQGRRHPELFQSLEVFLLHLQSGGCDPIGLYNTRELSQCQPQAEWLKGFELDFVGRLEDYAEELVRLSRLLGVPEIRDRHLNVSQRPRGMDRLSPRAARLIEELYRRDFDELGYEYL